MAGATISPSLPQLTQVFSEVKNVQFWVGLILTVPALFIAIGSPLVGRFIDRYGRMKIYFVGLLLYALAGSSGLYLDNFWMILVGRALLGVAVAIVMTVTVTLVGDYFQEEERQDFMGKQGVFMSLGGVLFVGAGGLLADLHWRMPFAIYFSSLLILGLVYFYLSEPHNQKRTVAENGSRFSWVHLVLYFTAFISMIVFYMVPVQIPFLIKKLGVEQNVYIGLAIACSTLGSVTTAANYRRIKTHIPAPLVLFAAFVCIGIGYLAVGFVSRFGFLFPSLIISGFGLGLMMPHLNNWVLEITPMPVRGKAVGLVSSMIFLGQFFSPIVINPIKAKIGISAVFLWTGVAVLLISLLYVIFKKPLIEYSQRPGERNSK